MYNVIEIFHKVSSPDLAFVCMEPTAASEVTMKLR